VRRAVDDARHDADGRILLVHRPKYDDWSLPKGKLEPDESDEEAALREVEEETGVHCRLGDLIGAVTYDDREGRPKVVTYWAMQPAPGSLDGTQREPDDEVDVVRWAEPEEALGLMTYERDRAILARQLGAGAPER